MDRVDAVVVGAGVVGLAAARALARQGREVVVLESEPVIGSQISSRNSGVIHAGIYYPQGSLKAECCVAGKHALYEYCATHGVTHQRIGKVLVATDDTQLAALRHFQDLALANGVHDLEYLTREDVHELEPQVACVAGLLSPSTGIVDSHDYLLALRGDAETRGVSIAVNAPFTSAEVDGHGFTIQVGGKYATKIGCDLMVNSAGLQAPAVAAAIRGLDRSLVPSPYYAKGNYFFLPGRSPFKRLVYPMPAKGSLGVHVSCDVAGRCRFGPDIHWVSEIDYTVDTDRRVEFEQAIRRYWPALPGGVLQPDYTGIRPKLTAQDAPAADFMIQTTADHDVPGLVNLFGIESPGLTASLAIADRVADAAARYSL